jgi:hypothetical protein
MAAESPQPDHAPEIPPGPTPLTDPRSLASAVVVHLLLLILVSLLAWRATAPAWEPPWPVVQADLGPIDNRAEDDSGGGGPGELGGLGEPGQPRITIDRLRDEVRAGELERSSGGEQELPGSMFARESQGPDRTGPPVSSGVGVVEGAGLGGGGGAGGGSGGGVGRGAGPSTTFFGTPERASSFAYVVDRSGSMANRGALELAKAELLASLRRLPPQARFCVLFYNIEPRSLIDPEGPTVLVPASPASQELVRARLAQIDAEGGTNHARALRAAFAARPEVVFLLTDGFHMTREQAQTIRDEAGTTRIHVVEFGLGPAPEPSGAVRWLAGSTGGTYRYVDILRYRVEAAARSNGHVAGPGGHPTPPRP